MKLKKRYCLAEYHEICPGCGAVVPAAECRTPAYLNNSPSCWSVYREVIDRHTSRSKKTILYRLLADSYAAQHPQVGTRSADRKLAVHLATLYLILQKGYGIEASSMALRQVAEWGGNLETLTIPKPVGGLTIIDLFRARSEAEYEQLIIDWAQSVWRGWIDSWDIVRKWVVSEPIY